MKKHTSLVHLAIRYSEEKLKNVEDEWAMKQTEIKKHKYLLGQVPFFSWQLSPQPQFRGQSLLRKKQNDVGWSSLRMVCPLMTTHFHFWNSMHHCFITLGPGGWGPSHFKVWILQYQTSQNNQYVGGCLACLLPIWCQPLACIEIQHSTSLLLAHCTRCHWESE